MVGLSRGQTDSASHLYLHPPAYNMSSQVSENLLPSPELNNNATPPRTTPSPDAADPGMSCFILIRNPYPFTYHNAPELKLSRKREREVSVEPVTTPTANNVLETRFCFVLSVYSSEVIADRIRSCCIVNEKIPLLH